MDNSMTQIPIAHTTIDDGICLLTVLLASFGVPSVALMAKSPMKNETFDVAYFCSVPTWMTPT